MTEFPTSSSGLFYHGTEVEVRLGDKVLWKRLIRKNLTGTVIYIPGQSPPHPDLEDEAGRQWAVELENGDILMMVYSPGHPKGQPRPNIRFLARGERKSLPPNVRIY